LLSKDNRNEQAEILDAALIGTACKYRLLGLVQSARSLWEYLTNQRETQRNGGCIVRNVDVSYTQDY
jgi:hypothetical protein